MPFTISLPIVIGIAVAILVLFALLGLVIFVLVRKTTNIKSNNGATEATSGMSVITPTTVAPARAWWSWSASKRPVSVASTTSSFEIASPADYEDMRRPDPSNLTPGYKQGDEFRLPLFVPYHPPRPPFTIADIEAMWFGNRNRCGPYAPPVPAPVSAPVVVPVPMAPAPVVYKSAQPGHHSRPTSLYSYARPASVVASRPPSLAASDCGYSSDSHYSQNGNTVRLSIYFDPRYPDEFDPRVPLDSPV